MVRRRSRVRSIHEEGHVYEYITIRQRTWQQQNFVFFHLNVYARGYFGAYYGTQKEKKLACATKIILFTNHMITLQGENNLYYTLFLNNEPS
jgi:hypothetical protein